MCHKSCTIRVGMFQRKTHILVCVCLRARARDAMRMRYAGNIVRHWYFGGGGIMCHLPAENQPSGLYVGRGDRQPVVAGGGWWLF